jgi:(1->4)-alpha-D-glucan 1-alpha-D-glucosylmutase
MTAAPAPEPAQIPSAQTPSASGPARADAAPGTNGPSHIGGGRHTPAAGRPVPVSTYRLQLRPEFTFDDAAAVVPHIAALGVTHVYCSPYLQAAPGSAHGYDVVDHNRLNAELGGEDGHARLVKAAREHGLGLVLDVVPNHSAISEPESQNAAWWDVLTSGRHSAFADWFDIEWETADNPGKVVVPVLGVPLGEAVANGEVRFSDDGTRITYYDHEVPVRPGTKADGDGPEAVLATLDRQAYRLSHWRVAGEELNYRRFFDVTTLAGVRVEDPEVFDTTHRLIVQQVKDGVLDGLRIDHPDGLADPEGYLRRLAAETDGSWVVVEKILEAAAGERLPATWPCAGTTGYDVLNRLSGLFVDPAGEEPLTATYGELTGEPTQFADVVDASKAYVLAHVMSAEVARLTELAVRAAWGDPRTRDFTRRGLREALVALLAEFEVYRAYVDPGAEPPAESVRQVREAAEHAKGKAPGRAGEVDFLADLVLTGPPEIVTRFQQTCGPVMAKGVEDTAFYRYHRLDALNEVGGDPGRFGTSPGEFHAAAAEAQSEWPLSMTTLSTHDTKRSEDVRARLAVLSEIPERWREAVDRFSAASSRHAAPAGPDANAQYLLWQTLVGAWPISAERAVAYAEKASREAKQRTTWTEPDPAYDEALQAFVRGVLADDTVVRLLEELVAEVRGPGRGNALAQKLLQLTMPGVPDVYQGSERWDLSLVDPDNRRPVDYGTAGALLARLDEPGAPVPDPDGDDGAAKLLVTSRALRLRREHPEWFGAEATYVPLVAEGERAENLVGFLRTDRVAVLAPRLTAGLAAAGGWGTTSVTLPAGTWSDRLTGATVEGGRAALADVLVALPVALLVREE